MPTTYKAFKYKLEPTAAQEAVLWDTLHACCRLYNAALEQRKIAWKYHRVSITRKQQEHEITAIRADMAEYAAIHVHVLQEVVKRLDRTFQRFFQRVKQGEKAGYPRFKGVNRYHSFTFKEYHNGAYVDNGSLVLSRIGRVQVLWSRRLEGTPKTVTIRREADGW